MSTDCQKCCSCTDDQLVLTDMWNCKYINLVKTFLNQSYYGDRCLAETTEKLFLHNAMFWLFQTNNGPTFPLNEYAGTGCKASTLMDTFPSSVCTDVVCDMIKKLEDLLGSCCTLSEGVKIGYCERGSKGEWEADYNNGLGYQVTDIVFFANQYWRNIIPNNIQSPSNNQVTSGWEICQNV